jgi:hypothetical protein
MSIPSECNQIDFLAPLLSWESQIVDSVKNATGVFEDLFAKLFDMELQKFIMVEEIQKN